MNGALGGITLYATVPASYQVPNVYKRSASGDILLDRGDEYYNDSVPFEGLYVSLMKDLIRISNGDIKDISYTHTSKASIAKHSSSKYTAAVQDIENGIVDMAVAPFWITAARLKMTAFTVPLVYDKTVLVIPTPGTDKSLRYESSKVLEPFTGGLWLVALAIIAVSAFLSVWFSEADRLARKRYGKSLRRLKKPEYRRKSVYARLALDAFLEKGLFFFSAGVEQDSEASLPHKMLMFGFGGFILIAVSAYVANLAAFLTRSGTESFVGTMEEVILLNVPICAHPALQDELVFKWPSANFIWSENEWNGVVDKYDAGECKVLAIGREDNILDVGFMKKFCDRGLVFTQSLIIETPIAFPIKPELASGLSYWIYQGEKYKGVSLQKSAEEYVAETGGLPCSIELSELDNQESDDYTQISPKNMILPIIFFLVFAIVAIILQVVHERRKGKGDLMGRTSTLELFADRPSKGFNESAKDAIKMLDSSVPFRLHRPSLFDEEKKDVEEEGCDLDVKKSVIFNDVSEDDFYNNDDNMAPRIKGLMGSSTITDTEGTPVRSYDENDLNHRIQKLIESGAIDDVLECFQEMKRLKKS